MSSLQSLRELISERLAAAAEEIFRLCEGTIVQYEQELCRQRRLLDICWKPQLQLHHIVLPQLWVNAEEDLCNQQRNFRVEQNNPELTQTKEKLKETELLHTKEGQEEQEPPWAKEEQEELEPPQIKKEQDELYISQDQYLFDLKQEMIEIPTFKGNKHDKAGLNKQQIFNATNIQDEEGSQSLNKNRLPSGENSRNASNLCAFTKTESDDGIYRSHRRTQSKKKPFYCKEYNKTCSHVSFLKIHMRTHTGEKPFLCKECDGSYSQASSLKRHMRAHTGEKPFSCKKCDKSFYRKSYLERHMRSHTGEKPFSCKKCDKRFNQTTHLRRHVRTHTEENPFSRQKF